MIRTSATGSPKYQDPCLPRGAAGDQRYHLVSILTVAAGLPERLIPAALGLRNGSRLSGCCVSPALRRVIPACCGRIAARRESNKKLQPKNESPRYRRMLIVSLEVRGR